jgi:hypothetical protein
MVEREQEKDKEERESASACVCVTKGLAGKMLVVAVVGVAIVVSWF